MMIPPHQRINSPILVSKVVQTWKFYYISVPFLYPDDWSKCWLYVKQLFQMSMLGAATPGNTSLVSLVILVCVSPVPGSRCSSGGGGEAGKLTLRRLVWGQLHQQQQFPLVTTLSSHHEHEQAGAGVAMVGKEESSCRAHAEKFQIFISVIFFYMDMFMFLW